MATKRPFRLVLAALLSVAAVVACATAEGALPARYDLVVAELTGDGYAGSHNGAFTSFAAGAFWEHEIMPFNSENTPPSIILPSEVDSLFGISFWANGGGGVKPCSSEYQLTQALHRGTATAAGPRFWTHADWSSLFGPDPGPTGILVSADPYFGDFARVSGGCNPGNGPLSDLNTRFVHHASCVVHPDGECSATIRVPKTTQSCGVNCSATYAGVIQLKVRRFGNSPPLDPIPSLIMSSIEPYIPFLDRLPSMPIGGPYGQPPPVILTPPKKGDGTLDETVYIAKQPVLKLKGKLEAKVKATLRPTLVRAGALAVQHITAPTRLIARIAFTPTGKPTRTIAIPFYVLPKAAARRGGGTTVPTITSVSFTGSAANPTIVVHGKNLGRKPAPSPAKHPAGLNGCPALAGDNGYDYGTSLYVVAPAKNWSGGRSRPTSNEVDCLDLVVTRFTQTEVDFHFGPFYRSAYPQFALTPGLQVQVAVNGATANAVVRY
jgi:hypothetical protein